VSEDKTFLHHIACDRENYITKNFIIYIRNRILFYRVEPGYNDIDLYDTSYIASDIVGYQLIPHS
jgi:hypothetical protein